MKLDAKIKYAEDAIRSMSHYGETTWFIKTCNLHIRAEKLRNITTITIEEE
jgi:hypothetical protein